MRIQIKVTKEIIIEAMYCGVSEACVWSFANCAITKAVQAIFPYSGTNKKGIHVYAMPLTKVRGKEISIIPLPRIAKDFINTFDAKTPEQRLLMEPISFEIDVPSEVIDQVGISQVYKILSESRTLELAVKYETI